jgi:RNA polymerase sigma-70 factor (ECF subfamily)
LTEAELIERAQQGDSEAFGALVEEHTGFVRRLTRTILRDVDDSDDAAQDAFFAAWRARDRFDPARPFKPWLAQIAVNAARDLQRRRSIRQTDPLPPNAMDHGSHPATAAELSLLRERLDAALAELPERQRVAVVLFDVEGFAHREIGALLGIPEGTVRSEVFHARRKLRTVLGPGEEAQ